MTILDLLVEDHITTKRIKSSHEEKYESPCPRCGGKDRFQYWPDQGKFYCRNCGISGDVIKYLTHLRGMDFVSACKMAGQTPSIGLPGRSSPLSRYNHSLHVYESPSIKWRSQAEKILHTSINCLGKEQYVNVRQELINARGLTEETIKSGNLGWLPVDVYQERDSWGLPKKLKDNGLPVKLWIPAGLVIPCFHNGVIQRIRIRKLRQDDGSRYYVLPGSSSAPLLLGDNTDAFIIVESDLDALLLEQEVGDLVGVISLGSANIKPDKETMDLLLKAKRVLVSLDSDSAGAKASWGWWMINLPNAIRWPVIRGKDPAESHLNGLSLRNWVETGLQYVLKEGCQKGMTKISIPRPIPHPMASAEEIRDLLTARTLSIGIGNERPVLGRYCSLCVPGGLPPILVDMKSDGTIDPLKELLENPVKKVVYDAKRVIAYFHEQGIEINGELFDISILDQILRAGLAEKEDRSLADVVTEYLGKPSLDVDPMGRLKDEAALLLKTGKVITERLKNEGLIETARLELSCSPATIEMERNGMYVDREKLVRMRDDLIPVKDNLEKKLLEELGPINLNSQSEIKEGLLRKGIILGNTSKGTIGPLSSIHPSLGDLIQYRKVSHRLSLVENIIGHINPSTGRIYAQYSQIGAPTGRFSCFEPNLQGIPKDKEFRSCFKAPEGNRLIIADYSQIELRIAAEISRDQRMIDAYLKGMDLHSLTASLITGKTIGSISKEDRQAAKAINFGLIYAMGPEGLMDYARQTYGVPLSLEQATKFRRKFLEAYTGISQWHQAVKRGMAKETRTLCRRRRLWVNTPKFTKLLNSPVQGTSADITKKGLWILHGRLQGTEVKIIACIHDEIILEASDDKAEMAARILEESMVEAGQHFLKTVPVKVEVSIANDWAGK